MGTSEIYHRRTNAKESIDTTKGRRVHIHSGRWYNETKAWRPWAEGRGSAKVRRRDVTRSCLGSSDFSVWTCCSFRDMVWRC